MTVAKTIWNCSLASAALLLGACSGETRGSDDDALDSPGLEDVNGDGDGDGDGDEGDDTLLDVGDYDISNGGHGDEEDDGCDAVDFLFVIDDSGSMADEQQHLIAAFDGFIAGIRDKLSEQSYHLGVVSSDEYFGNKPGCQQLGALVTQTAGVDSSQSSCAFPEGRRYLTGDDDLESLFACAAQIGTEGDGNERPMEAIHELVGAAEDGPGGCNHGFLRDEALLVVVIITDEEDDHEGVQCPGQIFGGQEGSAGDPEDWYADVVQAKSGDPHAVVVLSLVGPTGPDPSLCPPLDKCNDGIVGAEPANRIVEYTNMFDTGYVGRVCEDSYASFFASAVDQVSDACDDFEPPR